MEKYIKEKNIKWSLDLNPITILEFIEKVATITIYPHKCSNSPGWLRTSHFCWWYFEFFTQGSSIGLSFTDVNDVVLHLCSCRGGQGGVVLPIQLAEGG